MDWAIVWNGLTLLVAGFAVIVSIIAARYSRRQALAAEAQTIEAGRTRDSSERALGLQAKALETQAVALQSQAADTAKALEIAERNAEAVLLV
jgi:hypothetical protein